MANGGDHAPPPQRSGESRWLDRTARLERRVEWLQRAFVGVTALVSVGMLVLFVWVPRHRASVLRLDSVLARRFIVVNARGDSTAELGIDRVGVPGLFFGSKDPREPGVAIGMLGAGPQFHLRGSDASFHLLPTEHFFSRNSVRYGSPLTGIGLLGDSTTWWLMTGPGGKRIFHPSDAARHLDSVARAHPRPAESDTP